MQLNKALVTRDGEIVDRQPWMVRNLLCQDWIGFDRIATASEGVQNAMRESAAVSAEVNHDRVGREFRADQGMTINLVQQWDLSLTRVQLSPPF